MAKKKVDENKESKTGLGVTTETPEYRTVQIPKREAKNPQDVYDNVYVQNMKRRNLESEIKPYGEWIRHQKTKDKEGNEIIKDIPGDTGESKEEKGTRLLGAYFNSAIESLDRIKNLASPQYKLNEKQIKLMHDKLTEKITEIDNTFSGVSKTTEKIDFSKIE